MPRVIHIRTKALKNSNNCSIFRSPVELWNRCSTPATITTTSNDNRWNKQFNHLINIIINRNNFWNKSLIELLMRMVDGDGWCWWLIRMVVEDGCWGWLKKMSVEDDWRRWLKKMVEEDDWKRWLKAEEDDCMIWLMMIVYYYY